MGLNEQFKGDIQYVRDKFVNVLIGRNLDPGVITGWNIGEYDGIVYLVGRVAVGQTGKMEHYTRPDTLHQLSTACRKRVFISNTRGLRYMVVLYPPEKYPKSKKFPGYKHGVLRIGIDGFGREVGTTWDQIGGDLYHLIVAGITGYGKSVFLRLLAYQAILEGHKLLISDLDGCTFPIPQGHPSLMQPMGEPGDAEHARKLVSFAIEECARRGVLYNKTGGDPESLEEYNTLLWKSAIKDWRSTGRSKDTPVVEHLPRILVILDEYTATLSALDKNFERDIGRLGMSGRKFGINLVIAAQDASKDLVGAVRDQIGAICFYTRSENIARNLGCLEATQLKGLHGRVVTSSGNQVQVYFLRKEQFKKMCKQTNTSGSGSVFLPTNSLFTAKEEAMVKWAVEKNDGYLTGIQVQSWLGCNQNQARKLSKEWDNKGWLVKDPSKSNARMITPRLRELVAAVEN